MKRSNIIGIIAAAVVIIVSVVLISWYLRKTTPMLIQGTVECTTYKASSKVPGRIDDMKVSQGDRVEKGQLLYTRVQPGVHHRPGDENRSKRLPADPV